jgi:D-amino-acid oxidase
VDITVVGAGVIGLTTALALEQRGHAVRIVAAASGERTTSAVAGAIWFPYRVGPPGKAAVWAAHTRRWLESLAADASAGIDLVTGYEITDGEALPWWAAAVDVARAEAPVTGSPMAWRFVAPRVEPSLFLPWLTAQLHARIELRAVRDLAAEPGDAVVNCTGLGARELASDDALVPLFGQIAIAEVGAADRALTVTDDRDPEALFYVIPRRDELVLGGCSLPWPAGADASIDPALTTRIAKHAASLGVAIGPIRRERAGLRPFRPEVRLERDPRDPRVVHNYGHGGAGFTLCRGCADDVAQILTTPP